MTQPFQELSDDGLRARKEAVLAELLSLLARLGLQPDYPAAMIHGLLKAEVGDGDRIAVLEALVEIESIKYTLCARRLREIDPEEAL